MYGRCLCMVRRKHCFRIRLTLSNFINFRIIIFIRKIKRRCKIRLIRSRRHRFRWIPQIRLLICIIILQLLRKIQILILFLWKLPIFRRQFLLYLWRFHQKISCLNFHQKSRKITYHRRLPCIDRKLIQIWNRSLTLRIRSYP